MSIESMLRLAAFVLVFGCLVAIERLSPLREGGPSRARRMGNNFVLLAIGSGCLRALGPLSVVGAAFYAQYHHIGLAHWLDWRFALAFAVAFLVLDLGTYVQHRALHRWALLWRLHRVHHSDRDLDVSSGVRFHPGEILLSAVYKSALVVFLGAPPTAVVVFEMVLSSSSLFTHSNVAIAPRLERALRAVLVTPAMHWVHHSIIATESKRNFGFFLSCWDRWFNTYQEAPGAGLPAMALGVDGLDDECEGVWRLLRQPTINVATAGEAYTNPSPR